MAENGKGMEVEQTLLDSQAVGCIMLEEWAGHFGSRQERAEGVRRLEFQEDIANMADYVGLCLEGVSVFPEAFMECQLSYRQQDGLAVITRMITDAAQKTMRVLNDERRHAKECNKMLKNELAASVKRCTEAERAADPQAIAEVRSCEATLKACSGAFSALKRGTYGKDGQAAFDAFEANLRAAGVSVADAAACVLGEAPEAAEGMQQS